MFGGTEYAIELIDSSSNSLENVVIRKVIFEDNVSGGVSIEGLIPGSPVNYTLENNTFIGGQRGVKINVLEEQAEVATIRNNLFWDQSDVPIKIDSTTDGGIDYGYNLFSSCGQVSGGVCGATDWYDGTLSPVSTAHDNLLNLDPEFRDPIGGDYRLLPTSPVIDAGDPATENEMGLDGHIPLQTDIGAFEAELLLDIPDDVFQEANGQVVMEAEHFSWIFPRNGRTWGFQTNLADYTGLGYLSALPDTDLQFTVPYTTTSPELSYTINFTTTGTYYVWLRGYAPNGAGDSVQVGLNGQFVDILTGFTPRVWNWANRVQKSPSTPSEAVTIEINQPGVHTLHLWQREDGLRVDKILLTTEGEYNPGGNGPPESEIR